jgi:hypothetical protein
VTSERSTVPHLGSWLGQKRWHVLGDDLISHVASRSVVLLVRVLDSPSASLVGIVVRDGLLGGLEELLDSPETVAVEVVLAANFSFIRHHIDLNNLVVKTVDHGVNAVGEDVLVVLSGDTRGNLNLVGGVAGLVGTKRVCVDDTGCLDLELDGAIKGEVEVETVLVIGDGTDARNHKLAVTCDVDLVVTEVGVLRKSACDRFSPEDSPCAEYRRPPRECRWRS